MSPDNAGGDRQHPRPTPEEQAAFDERLETLAGYEELVRASAAAENQELGDRIDEATKRDDRAEVDRLQGLRAALMQRSVLLVVALIVAMIVALALWATRGSDDTDVTAGLDDTISEIAPPEPADSPAEVLPAEVFTYTCSDGDMSTVTQVPLNLNPDARYQFGYEAGGSRIAIFSVVDGDQYDSMASSLSAEYAQAKAAGDEVTAPRELAELGDDAMIYESTVIFRNGDEAALLWANTLEDAGGEASVTIKPDELEQLARIAAPRM
jgi:hypothetical protein